MPRTRSFAAAMTARDPHEEGRSATVLELFFDLVFVVAIAQAASNLHHELAAGHTVDGLVNYAVVFFAIWWAWMSFTWFASAYDPDDTAYRLGVFVQIVGSLFLAAGVNRAFDGDAFGGDWTIFVIGYVILRVPVVWHWWRASNDDPANRASNRRYAMGVSVLQVGWILLQWAPEGAFVVLFLLLGLGELAVPPWAERASPHDWRYHAEHITERYGLLTIIVLGEAILASALALQVIIDGGAIEGRFVEIIVGALLTVLSMWWIYFDRPTHDLLTDATSSIKWGYGHYFIFSSVAAAGAGVAVAVDVADAHAEASATDAALIVGIGAALFVLAVWWLHDLPHGIGQSESLGMLVGAGAIVVVAAASANVLWVGVVLALVAATRTAAIHQDQPDGLELPDDEFYVG